MTDRRQSQQLHEGSERRQTELEARAGQRLRDIIEARGIPYSIVAQRANISYPTVWRVVHGVPGIKLATLEALAQALDVPVSELLKDAA